jgi:hypothetical protein
MNSLTALRSSIRTAPVTRRRATNGQHLVTVALATWLTIGLFVDGWAHNNLDESLETFFTPWHALFYSGFTACAVWLLWLVRRGRQQGLRGADAVPLGYGLGLVGLVVFAVGGAGDLSWHLVFGIERDIEALFSPTHLMLFAGAALILASPFRDAWNAPGPTAPGLRSFLPALMSLSLVVSLVAFFFMYWSPYTVWTPTRQAAAYADGAPADYAGSLRYFQITDGVSVALTTTLLLIGPLLLIIRRWRAPAGSATILFTVPAVLSSAIEGFAQPILLVAAPIAGLVTDGLIRWLRPAPDRRTAVRLIAVLSPMVLFSAWFTALSLTAGIWYPIEVWSGTVVWTGLTGLGLALLMLPTPPPAPSEQPRVSARPSSASPVVRRPVSKGSGPPRSMAAGHPERRPHQRQLQREARHGHRRRQRAVHHPEGVQVRRNEGGQQHGRRPSAGSAGRRHGQQGGGTQLGQPAARDPWPGRAQLRGHQPVVGARPHQVQHP